MLFLHDICLYYALYCYGIHFIAIELPRRSKVVLGLPECYNDDRLYVVFGLYERRYERKILRKMPAMGKIRLKENKSLINGRVYNENLRYEICPWICQNGG